MQSRTVPWSCRCFSIDSSDMGCCTRGHCEGVVFVASCVALIPTRSGERG
jgi:hypothetical protein